MAKKEGYVLIGKPYLRHVHSNKYDSYTEYIAIRSENIESVHFSITNKKVHGRLSKTLGIGDDQEIDIYVPQIVIKTITNSGLYGGFILRKFGKDQSIVESVRNDYIQLIKIFTNENKIVNLSDFDVKPSGVNSDDDSTDDTDE